MDNSKKRKVQSTLDKFKLPFKQMQTESKSLPLFGLSKPSQPKRIVIKSLKVPSLPPNYQQNTWMKLKQSIDAVYSQQHVPFSLEELYKDVENLCRCKWDKELWELLNSEVEQRVHSIREALVDQPSLLVAMNSQWHTFCQQMVLSFSKAEMMVRSIFLYLDRTFIIQKSQKQSLWDASLDHFREIIIRNDAIYSRFMTEMLDSIKADRDHKQVPRDLLASLVKMHLDLGVYFTMFEPRIMTRTSAYYLEEAKIHALDINSASTVAAYLRHYSSRLEQELDRCNGRGLGGYIDVGSKKSLVAILQYEFLVKHMDAILGPGFEEMLDRNQILELRLLFTHVSSVDDSVGLSRLEDRFGKFLVARGLDIVMNEKGDPAKDSTMVKELLHFKDRMDILLNQSFESNLAVANTLKKSFESFINKRPNKPAEMIAKHIDGLMKTNKGKTETEIENELDKCLVLFRFIIGKDMFESFYKKDLAKRLLLGKSSSIDVEKSMLSKLKSQCGSEFTKPLESMFADIDTSHTLMTSFRNSDAARGMGNIDFFAYVLTESAWPTYPIDSLILPQEISRFHDAFKNFFTQNNNGKKLTWANVVGQGILRSYFPKGTKELMVSSYQASVLLLFNDKDDWGYIEIKRRLNLDDKELKRTLQSLACSKVRALVKSSPTKEVTESDVFSFNTDFTHQLTRIKVNMIQARETPKEQQETEQHVLVQRQHQLDAAICRVMKSRKQLTHQELVGEVMSILKFPTISDIKNRIEILIEREYLCRDVTDRKLYNYVA